MDDYRYRDVVMAEPAIDEEWLKLNQMKRELREMKNQMLAQQIEEKSEEIARLTTPALMEAWQQYQTLLRLTQQ